MANQNWHSPEGTRLCYPREEFEYGTSMLDHYGDYIPISNLLDTTIQYPKLPTDLSSSKPAMNPRITRISPAPSSPPKIHKVNRKPISRGQLPSFIQSPISGPSNTHANVGRRRANAVSLGESPGKSTHDEEVKRLFKKAQDTDRFQARRFPSGNEANRDLSRFTGKGSCFDSTYYNDEKDTAEPVINEPADSILTQYVAEPEATEPHTTDRACQRPGLSERRTHDLPPSWRRLPLTSQLKVTSLDQKKRESDDDEQTYESRHMLQTTRKTAENHSICSSRSADSAIALGPDQSGHDIVIEERDKKVSATNVDDSVHWCNQAAEDEESLQDSNLVHTNRVEDWLNNVLKSGTNQRSPGKHNRETTSAHTPITPLAKQHNLCASRSSVAQRVRLRSAMLDETTPRTHSGMDQEITQERQSPARLLSRLLKPPVCNPGHKAKNAVEPAKKDSGTSVTRQARGE